MTKLVTLKPTWRGDTAGYAAVLVERYECEWTGENVDTDVEIGPWSDAELVARSRGIEWASTKGVRYVD